MKLNFIAKVRRWLSVVIVLFCGAVPLVALQYWGEGVFADFGFFSKKSVPKGIPLEGTLGIRKTFSKTELFAAVCSDSFAVDASGNIMFFPLQKQRFQLGISYLSHISKSFPVKEEPDLFVWDNLFMVKTMFNSKNTENPFKTVFSLGVNTKKTTQWLTSNILELYEAYPVMELRFTKRFLKKHEAMFRFATFDPLHIKIFWTTWWQLGYSYDISEKITLGTLLEVTYADQITLSGTMSGWQGKLFAAYKL